MSTHFNDIPKYLFNNRVGFTLSDDQYKKLLLEFEKHVVSEMSPVLNNNDSLKSLDKYCIENDYYCFSDVSKEVAKNILIYIMKILMTN